MLSDLLLLLFCHLPSALLFGDPIEVDITETNLGQYVANQVSVSIMTSDSLAHVHILDAKYVFDFAETCNAKL